MCTLRVYVTSNIKSSPQNIWSCFTNPFHIANWFVPTELWYMHHEDNELLAGNNYSVKFVAINELVADPTSCDEDVSRILAYSFANGRKVDIILEKQDNDTIISIAFDAEIDNPIEAQQLKWLSMISNLKKYVEQIKIV